MTTASGRRRILLAPVTVSPTKPLTPSHLKVLLSMDVLRRGSATFAEVSHLYRPLAHAGSRQVAGFWEYLDRCHPQLSFQASTEEQIGELYGQFQRAERVPYPVLEPVVRRAEAGWTHPATARLLELWQQHYRLLGMLDPLMGGQRSDEPLMGGQRPDGPSRPDRLPTAELIELLVRHHLCIDGRPFGAPVYLDATAAGLPLRMMVSAEGQANYLVSTLSELVPKLADHDHVVLAHDTEIRADYRTIAYLLTRLGAEVSRIEFGRVPLDGVARSTRFGGWHGYTVGALSEPLLSEFGVPAFALGLRLYLIAGLGRTATDSFSVRHLRRWVQRADRLLAEHGSWLTSDPPSSTDRPQLSALAGRLPYLDPHRLISTLLSRTATIPAAGLLEVVLGPNLSDSVAVSAA
jgi:hypothetical protein